MTIGKKKEVRWPETGRTSSCMHAPDTRPLLARPKKHVHPTTMAQKQRAARSERLPAKPAPALLATTPAEALPEATRRGRARRWRPRRGRGAKGSNGEREPCCESQTPKIVRTGLSERAAWLATGSCVRGRLAGVPDGFFLILVLQLLETSTDHFIFNTSEV